MQDQNRQSESREGIQKMLIADRQSLLRGANGCGACTRRLDDAPPDLMHTPCGPRLTRIARRLAAPGLRGDFGFSA